MLIERFFVPGLAHVSYLLASGDEAVVVDPERHVDGYLAYLARNELKLRGIFLTHPHADFVAGHAELAARSGAEIFISGRAPATFVHRDLKEGDRLALGTLELEVIETPGHSPDSICLSVLESGFPVALFSGDTLFAGDVGRPDLRDGEVGSQELAAMLHDSLFDKLLKLPSEVKVYPAHGAGSLCGRQISSAPFLSDRPALTHLGPAEFDLLKQRGATTLDVRPAALFGDAHAAGSVNIGVAGPSFSVWCGFFVNPDLPIALVVEYESEAQRAQLELARIGFDDVVGFISTDDLDETLQITQMGARDFLASFESSRRPHLVDVRSAQEWNHDHLEGAVHIPLPQLLRRLGGIPRNAPLTVVCGSGYRSSIAASLLESEGFDQLINVMGGMHAVRHAKRPRIPVMELADNAIAWEI
jgi:hydroxyacylglutathione hydrolase